MTTPRSERICRYNVTCDNPVCERHIKERSDVFVELKKNGLARQGITIIG